MTCQEYWEQHWADTAGSESARRFAAHLASCPSCAARSAAERPVVAGLSLLAADMQTVSAPARLEANLLRVYRERYPARASSPCEVRHWWAAAAAVLLVASALWIGGRHPSAPPLEASNSPAMAGVEEGDAAFIPLPGAAALPQDEDVDLVRVELPRSAITALGIPNIDEGAAESVEAEVLVGQDGMARAVRFLN